MLRDCAIMSVYLLSSLFIIEGSMGLQSCQDKIITFTSEPHDVITECGNDEAVTATFPCQYTGSTNQPQWVINSTEYSSLDLPAKHKYNASAHVLTVSDIRNKNSTTYQCQVVLNERPGVLCAYKSSIGQLIIGCEGAGFKFQCLPYYNYNTRCLDKINTTIFETKKSNYFISFWDSILASAPCFSHNISAASCVNGTCEHIFEVSSSPCARNTSISVTLSASNHSGANSPAAPSPIKIDGFNNFVQVSVEQSVQEISIKCMFMNRPINNKFCGVVYGPDCKDLSAATHSDADVDDSSNTITLNFDILNDLGDAKNTCFVITASNNAKTVNIVYIYTGSGVFIGIHQTRKLKIVCGVLMTSFITHMFVTD